MYTAEFGGEGGRGWEEGAEEYEGKVWDERELLGLCEERQEWRTWGC